MHQRNVTSGEVSLAVREYGEPAAPTLVAVHGYPDSQAMWAPLAERLAPEVHVVTYDVRGSGESTVPRDRTGYRTERLVDDLVTVIDATSPDRPVHLLGHDWGSVALWDAVTTEDSDPRLQGRIASYTSVSGPSLDHVAAFIRTAPRREQLGQTLHSWYVYLFLLPLLPELVWRHLGGRIVAQLARRERLTEGAWGDSVTRDAVNGLELYRANLLRRLRHPGSGRTRVPVQLVVPSNDPFIWPGLLDGLERYVETLHRVDLDCGHWVPRSRPEELADLTRAWMLAHQSPA